MALSQVSVSYLSRTILVALQAELKALEKEIEEKKAEITKTALTWEELAKCSEREERS